MAETKMEAIRKATAIELSSDIYIYLYLYIYIYILIFIVFLLLQEEIL